MPAIQLWCLTKQLSQTADRFLHRNRQYSDETGISDGFRDDARSAIARTADAVVGVV
jgi:hypothetical protein